jgi:5'-methylthioadenosine phosphorylase
LWALRALGVRQVLAPSAVGRDLVYGPGTLAVPDQVVDRTRSRPSTFYDQGAVHVPFADSYCLSGRSAVISAARSSGWTRASLERSIEGPRFSSRAESQWFAAQGWTLIGMTGLPEAALARELALCYTTIALVTDTDAGVGEGEGVTHAEVFRVFGENVDRLRGVVAAAIERLPAERNCPCPASLDGIELPLSLP